MNAAKLHHYVPRFYLARFADAEGPLWAFDKSTGHTFRTSPRNVAGEGKFYDVPELNAWCEL